MPHDIKRMERDILETVHRLGRIGYFNGAHSPGSQFLLAKYSSDEEEQQLTVLMKYLLEKRYVFPFFDGRTGEELNAYIRGLTPKGYKRLKELQHEWKTWLWRNGFAVAIATITALAAIGSIVVDATCNRG